MTHPKRRSKFRRMYPILIELGLVASLLLIIGAFRMKYQTGTQLGLTSAPIEPIELVPVVPTDITPKPPPPPRPPVPVVVPDDEPLNADPIPIDVEIHIFEAPPVPPPPPPVVDPRPDDPFEVVEDMPVIIGGMADIMNRIRYPEIAKKAGIEGLVVIQFIVERDGSVADATVIKGIGGGCDEEALKAVLATRFTPGMQRKVPVRVWMRLPIRFKMKN